MLSQTAQPGGGATLQYAGTTASDILIVSAGKYIFPAGAGSGIGQINLGTLNVGAGAEVELAQSSSQSNRSVLVLNSLSIAGSSGNWAGTLDLADNDLIVESGSLSTVNSQIAGGYDVSGNWEGNGLTSSAAAGNASHLTALGVLSNNNGEGAALYGNGTSLGLFDGVNPAVGDILIKYTYYGDANLDGRVDGSDYTKIDNGYLTHAAGWYNGDCNYDGVIDGSDFALIDNAFNTQGASLAANIASQVIARALASSVVVPHAVASSILIPGMSKFVEQIDRRPLVDNLNIARNRHGVFNSTVPISMPMIELLPGSIVEHRVKHRVADMLSDNTVSLMKRSGQ